MSLFSSEHFRIPRRRGPRRRGPRRRRPRRWNPRWPRRRRPGRPLDARQQLAAGAPEPTMCWSSNFPFFYLFSISQDWNYLLKQYHCVSSYFFVSFLLCCNQKILKASHYPLSVVYNIAYYVTQSKKSINILTSSIFGTAGVSLKRFCLLSPELYSHPYIFDPLSHNK